MKMRKIATKWMVLVVVILPSLVMADVVAPELSHIETTTYIHRLHRIGYELLKEECDTLGAVDCVSSQEYGMSLWFAVAAVLIGVALLLGHRRVREGIWASVKWLFGICRRKWMAIGGLSFLVVVLACLVNHFGNMCLSEFQVAFRDVHVIEYVDEIGWVYADKVSDRWLRSCVALVERIRKPLKRHMHIAPDVWNNTATSDVIGALKSTPTLLKQCKGIAIEVLVAAVRAADKDTDYLKNIGKEVSQQRIIDRKGGNPNVGRCSRCGYKGYLPTHPCGEDHHRAKYSEQRFKTVTE